MVIGLISSKQHSGYFPVDVCHSLGICSPQMHIDDWRENMTPAGKSVESKDDNQSAGELTQLLAWSAVTGEHSTCPRYVRLLQIKLHRTVCTQQKVAQTQLQTDESSTWTIQTVKGGNAACRATQSTLNCKLNPTVNIEIT